MKLGFEGTRKDIKNFKINGNIDLIPLLHICICDLL